MRFLEVFEENSVDLSVNLSVGFVFWVVTIIMPLSADERKRVEFLQQKLNTIRVQLERLERYLEGTNPNPKIAGLRFDELAALYHAAFQHQEDLLSIDPNNPQLEAFVAVEARYFEVASVVKTLQPGEASGCNTTLNASNVIVTERQSMPRLPEMKIPTFDGKQENWANYKNKFLSLVHSRSDISEAVKCGQLFDSLTGSALAKVVNFEPNEQDYPKAWKTLLECFDHKRIVAVEHMAAILDFPPLQAASSEDLSKLMDTARQHLHILEGLGVDCKSAWIVEILGRHLPPTIRNKWAERLDMDELPLIEDFFKFLQNAIFRQQSRERALGSQKASTIRRRPGETPNAAPSKRSRGNAHAFVTSSSPAPSISSSNPLSCPKCQQIHRLFKCPAFIGLAIQDRWSFIKSIKACYNCLWVHQFPCRSDKRCRKCDQKHHTLLHNERDNQQSHADDAKSSAVA